MGDQLRADLGRIHDLVRQLNQLCGNLSDTPTRFDEMAGAMGNDAMSAATTAFGEDWGLFRGQLIADLTRLGVFAETAAQSYAGVDSDLAGRIHGILAPPSHKPMPD